MTTATDLIQRLRDEGDLCKNDGAEDITSLLWEAADALAQAPAQPVAEPPSNLATRKRWSLSMSDKDDPDERWLDEFDRLKKGGRVVLTREEWRTKLEDAYNDGRQSVDAAQTQAYIDGRNDQREEAPSAQPANAQEQSRLDAVEHAQAAWYRSAHPDDPAAPEPESATFAGRLGDIPITIHYTDTCAGVIVDGVAVGDDYAEASCFKSGLLSVWREAIESSLERAAEGYVS